MGKFGSAINCMDGRVQECVNNYIKETYGVDHVDTITLAGPVKVLGQDRKIKLKENVKFRLGISINGHGSRYVAVVGHHDCAGVKESDELHKEYILNASKQVESWYDNVLVEAIWVDENFTVTKLQGERNE